MPRPLRSPLYFLAPLGAVLLLGCVHAPGATDLPDLSAAGDAPLIVVTAEHQDTMSAAQANAIRSFNREALDVLAIEDPEHETVELIEESSL